MKRQWSLLFLIVLAVPAVAQDASSNAMGPRRLPSVAEETFQTSSAPDFGAEKHEERGFLTSDHCFPNFIGFVSNPTLSLDPRSLTQITPVFTSTRSSAFPPFPDGDVQVLGPGVSLALTDRLSAGLSKGGYAFSHFRKERDGFLNLGGFAQYAVIRDVPDQFLFTVGIQCEAPTGESSVFQGHGPAYLAPYFTFAKELGKFHVLGTTGYQFPTGSGRATTEVFYTNLHIDRQVCGWLYPLVEFNGSYHTTSIDLNARERPGFIDIDRHDATGNIVTVAPGFNAVIVHDRLEIGAVYETPIYSQNHFHFDGVLVKMVLRF